MDNGMTEKDFIFLFETLQQCVSIIEDDNTSNLNALFILGGTMGTMMGKAGDETAASRTAELSGRVFINSGPAACVEVMNKYIKETEHFYNLIQQRKNN